MMAESLFLKESHYIAIKNISRILWKILCNAKKCRMKAQRN